MKKYFILFMFAFLSASIYSQCSSSYVSATYQPGGQVDFMVTGYSMPPGWAVSIEPHFGDFTVGNFNDSVATHNYQFNGNYFVNVLVHYYWILDTTFYCNVSDTITVHVANANPNTYCNLNFTSYQHCLDSVFFTCNNYVQPGIGAAYTYGPIITSANDTLNNPFGIPLSYTPWPDSAAYTYQLYYMGNLVCTGLDWVSVPATISPYGLDIMADYNSISDIELNDTSSTNMLFKNCDWGDGIITNNIYDFSAFHSYLLDGDYQVIASAYADYVETTWLPYHPTCLTLDTVMIAISGISNSLSCNLQPVVDYNFGTHVLDFALWYDGQKISSPNLNVSWSFDNGSSSTLDFGSFSGVITPPTSFTVTYSIADYSGTIVCNNSSTMAVNNIFSPCNALVYIYEDTINPGLYWAIDQSSGGITPYSYLWDFGDGTTSALQFPTHVYSPPGLYTVCLTITDGQIPPCVSTYCQDSVGLTPGGSLENRMSNPVQQVNVYNPFAIGLEESVSNDFNLFPNPVSDFIILNAGENYGNELNVSIYNVAGQILSSQKYPNAGNITIGLEEWAEGVYFLKVEDGVKSMTRKFIKK